jgi:dTDP-4-amino-4,6-dideoxy-D-galactose acyltransferase
MTTLPVALEQLGWDSEHFGFPIARLHAEHCTVEQLHEAVDAAQQSGIRCIYLLLDAADDARLDAAQRAGFLVRDVRLELERPLDGTVAEPNPAREARATDIASLDRIARERFTDARFFTDLNFPAHRAADLYGAWLRRGLDSPERRVWVAGDAEGFLIAHFDEQERTGRIELIAVAAGSEGRGHGATLVAAAGGRFAAAGLRRARVVTQGRNLAAQRLYQRMGYRTIAVGLWLHWWGES